MKIRNFTYTVCSALMVIALSNGTRADDKDAKAPELDPAQIEAMMKEFAAPGPQHEQFKRLVGNWKTESKSWFPNPEAPSTSTGKAKFTSIMGGRFLKQDFTGKYDGQEFTGMGISGYDKAQKKFVGTWLDNFGTGIMHTEGTYDEKTHMLTEVGSSHSPMGETKMRMTSHYVDDDKFVFTMFMVTPDGEQKIMEITYTRAVSKDDAK